MTSKKTSRRKSDSSGGTKARRTMYRGILMRSRLEADFAAWLDRAGAEWDYEPQCFAGPGGQWLPDFGAKGPGGWPVYFEIKPESLADEEIDPLLEQMTVAWLSEPEAILQLTIWRYGKPQECENFIGIRPEEEGGLTWWMSEGAGDMYAYPGMGQLRAFVERAAQEEEAKAGKP